VLFEFWLKIFGVAFGLGVVSGIVMAFQFGTNWSVLSKMSGPIQGPLLMYETFTAFMLEASFFGVLIFGRSRVLPWFYLFSTAMVALGTTFSAFWIMVNNSWMQVPSGYVTENGIFVPDDWTKIIFNSVVWSRFPHMLLASYLTGAFCVAATGAWYLLRKVYHAESRIMVRMGLGLAALLMPIQATISLVIFCTVYAFIFLFGMFYIYRLIRNGPMRKLFDIPHVVVPNRPMSLADDEPIPEPSYVAGE
jgi:cytochrome bd ubiquinol oxidase subunit I